MDTLNSEDKKAYEVSMTTKPEATAARQVKHGELIAFSEVEPALAAKMQLLNEAINQIGWTNYHLKLFCLNGFGYAADSLLAYLMSISAGQVALEFQPSYTRGGTVALYVGFLVGALFWGLSADIIGRKWAFNCSLFLAAVAAIVTGAMPSFNSWAALVSIGGFAAGGNLVLDTTVFLEFLPSKSQWLVTFMAAWWGLGQTAAAFLAWAFIPNFSCSSAEDCPRSSNMGWRYLYFTGGGLITVMSILRVTVIRFHETPKYLLCKGKDEEMVRLLQKIATDNGRHCDLTVEQLAAQGTVTSAHSRNTFSLDEIWVHYRGLFSTRKLAISTCLVWLSWLLIGLGYSLYFVFLPDYLASRGAEFGQTSPSVTWRNYTLAQVSAIFGPILGGFLCRIPAIGRRYTMVIGALLTMVFFFAYTAIRSEAENVAFNCVVSFAINIYYGTLYAYSPEVLPSAHRATGNGTAVAMNRIMGIMSAIIATYANSATSVPVYISAALFVAMAAVAALFPFEPQNSQSA